jgi:diaminohydroxyphosphoribosylaminopyrimidine deaminase/5-amino-6-(5-phosphoribosylamino)uracil reductase
MSLINDFTFHEKKKTLHYFKMGRKSGWFYRAKENQKKPVWITNQYSRQLVHKWRTEEQAILVGTQTVIDDNPKLNARDWHGTTH